MQINHIDKRWVRVLSWHHIAVRDGRQSSLNFGFAVWYPLALAGWALDLAVPLMAFGCVASSRWRGGPDCLARHKHSPKSALYRSADHRLRGVGPADSAGPHLKGLSSQSVSDIGHG